MTKRIIFGILMILVFAGIVVADWRLARKASLFTGPGVFAGMGAVYKGIPLAAAIFVLIPIAFWELYRLAHACGVRLLAASTLLGAMLIGLEPYWVNWVYWKTRVFDGADVLLLLMGLCILMPFISQIILRSTQDAMKQIGCSLLVMLYIGIGTATLLQMRIEMGLASFVLFILAVKFTDIGAYFTGTAIGIHKMIPWLSPKKSWEGLIGGLVLAVGLCVLMSWLSGKYNLPDKWHLDGGLPSIARSVFFGLAVGLAGQFADLCESLLKRSAQAKDSGTAIPGFGGLLDVMDSIILAAPVA
ncbi:MAG: phosphatidate cytidylyltransferase, partial [Planctomycetes bacterium]|nr:phosphatidate cytidylyltransferase [Planctomycetota bacterium]